MMKKLLTIILLLVVIAAFTLPKVIGSQGRKIHNNYFNNQAKALMPGVTIESENLEDGWFKSEGQHRVKLSESVLKSIIPGVKNIEMDNEVDLLVNTKFHHGPFAFTAFGGEGSSFSPVMAVSESTFAIDSQDGKVELPGKLFTQVDPLGGGGTAIYAVDQYSKKLDDGAMVEFEGMNIEFDIDDKGSVLDSKGKGGKLQLVSDDGSVSLSGFSFDSDLEKESGMWLGDSNINFEAIEFFDKGEGTRVAIENITLAGGNDGNSEKIDTVGKVSIGELVVSDIKLEDFTLDYELTDLDTQAISKIQAASKQAGANPAGQAEMMGEFKKILARSPKLNIKELSVKTPGGKLMADMQLGFGKDVDMTFFPFSLLPQIQADADIRVPTDVLVMIEKAKPGVLQQAEMMSEFGMLKKEGNDFIAVINMQDGKFTVNGNEVPLTQMLGM